VRHNIIASLLYCTINITIITIWYFNETRKKSCCARTKKLMTIRSRDEAPREIPRGIPTNDDGRSDCKFCRRRHATDRFFYSRFAHFFPVSPCNNSNDIYIYIYNSYAAREKTLYSSISSYNVIITMAERFGTSRRSVSFSARMLS